VFFVLWTVLLNYAPAPFVGPLGGAAVAAVGVSGLVAMRRMHVVGAGMCAATICVGLPLWLISRALTALSQSSM